MKTTFISTSWRKQCLTFCNLRPILKTRSTIIHIIIQIFNEYLLIYLFALIVAFAKEFATALLEKPRNAIKVTFGSHIRKLHLDCNQHMIEFAKDARESGIFFLFLLSFHFFISIFVTLVSQTFSRDKISCNMKYLVNKHHQVSPHASILITSSSLAIDLFSLYILFSHFRPRDALMGIFLLFFH